MISTYPPIELMELWARERAHPLSNPIVSEIVHRCEGRQIVLLLNAESLSDNDEPNKAAGMLESLDKLSRAIEVVLISKRSVRSLRHWFGLPSVTYCGGDGMEILMADDSSVIASSAIDCLPALVRGETELRNRLRAMSGASVDRDVFLLSVGIEADENTEPAFVRALVAGVKARHPKLCVRFRTNTIELLPLGAVSSRRDAVQLLLSRLRSCAEEPIPIYIGRREEDGLAFDSVRRQGGIVVECGEVAGGYSRLAMTKPQVVEFLKIMAGVVMERPCEGEPK